MTKRNGRSQADIARTIVAARPNGTTEEYSHDWRLAVGEKAWREIEAKGGCQCVMNKIRSVKQDGLPILIKTNGLYRSQAIWSQSDIDYLKSRTARSARRETKKFYRLDAWAIQHLGAQSDFDALIEAIDHDAISKEVEEEARRRYQRNGDKP